MGSESESDNESPEVISSVSMKSQREQELREMFTQKRKLRDEQKLKRKLKAEKFATQKKEKLAKKLLEVEHDDDKEGNSGNEEDSQKEAVDSLVKLPVAEEESSDKTKKISIGVHSKIYPKYNIVVEPLTRGSNPRASAALSFKEKRLAKVPRESVSNLIAHKEKLSVKNT